MVKLSEIFNIYTGSKLDFGKQTLDIDGINFVSRNSNNNGVVGKVELKDGMKIYKKGDITVPLGGSFLLSAFVQNEDFVTAQNVDVLRPKKKMTELEKWFYCYVLRVNRFKFSAFGREVNKYIQDIEVPSDIPNWVYDSNITLPQTKNRMLNVNLNISNWEYFDINELFEITAGNYHYNYEYEGGNTPYITATNKNNGISTNIDLVPEFRENTITTEKVNCCAFYQNRSFCATSDVNILVPKFKMNKYIALFIVTIINYDQNYRWNYGRQCRVGDTKKIIIKLPTTNDNKPDFNFMENYIKNLPYADLLN